MVDASLLNWTLTQLLTVLIIMTRVGSLIFFMPIIGGRNVPNQIKILVALLTTLVLANVVSVNTADLPGSPIGYLIFATGEIMFSGVLAIFARLVFASVQIAGQMVGIQMGMGMAGVMDPQFGSQISPVGQLWNLLTMLIFLTINGHYAFFSTVAESFQWVRPGNIHLSQATYQGLMQGTTHMFILAVKIMAPATAALFFSHVAMGIIAKTVPQIPILIVGMPLNIGIGLIFVILSLGYFFPLMIKNFENLSRLLPQMAKGMGM